MLLAMWQARAMERSAFLKIEQRKLLESVEIVSALGTDWMEGSKFSLKEASVEFPTFVPYIGI